MSNHFTHVLFIAGIYMSIHRDIREGLIFVTFIEARGVLENGRRKKNLSHVGSENHGDIACIHLIV